MKESILPGDKKTRYFSNAISDTDFAICFFEGKKVSFLYINQIKMSDSIKLKQEKDGAIIPVFVNMTADEADELIERYPPLRFLTLYAASYTGEEGWEKRLITKLTTPSLGE